MRDSGLCTVVAVNFIWDKDFLNIFHYNMFPIIYYFNITRSWQEAVGKKWTFPWWENIVLSHTKCHRKQHLQLKKTNKLERMLQKIPLPPTTKYETN
jgi:hypothetical protein